MAVGGGGKSKACGQGCARGLPPQPLAKAGGGGGARGGRRGAAGLAQDAPRRSRVCLAYPLAIGLPLILVLPTGPLKRQPAIAVASTSIRDIPPSLPMLYRPLMG